MFTAAGYQLLFPFATLDEALQWQVAERTGGHQPWHGDAGMTALAFTQGYLGYTQIDKVVSQTVGAADARVSVGYAVDATRTNTAAVIHLVRLGSGSDAGWEVVGTDDSADFTLTTPSYGKTVSSPVTVGGTINGVEESIDVQVHGLSSDKGLGRACCLPAGGASTSWSTSVAYSGAKDAVLTIAASTGGHIQTVERFVVTGVRVSP